MNSLKGEFFSSREIDGRVQFWLLLFPEWIQHRRSLSLLLPPFLVILKKQFLALIHYFTYTHAHTLASQEHTHTHLHLRSTHTHTHTTWKNAPTFMLTQSHTSFLSLTLLLIKRSHMWAQGSTNSHTHTCTLTLTHRLTLAYTHTYTLEHSFRDTHSQKHISRLTLTIIAVLFPTFLTFFPSRDLRRVSSLKQSSVLSWIRLILGQFFKQSQFSGGSLAVRKDGSGLWGPGFNSCSLS